MKSPVQLQSIADIGIQSPKIGDVLVFNGTVWLNQPTPLSGKIQITSPSTSLAATAGSAALPTAPAGFLEVDLGGTTYKIPYYDV